MVGVGSNCTRSTIDGVAALEGTPALTSLPIVVPYYTRPTPAGILDHFRAIAAVSRTPIVAYKRPLSNRPRAGRRRTARAGRHARYRRREAGGRRGRPHLELLRRKPRDFQVLAGDDAFIAPTILMGGVGAIAASAHGCTDLLARMIDAALAGVKDTPATLAHALLPVVTAGFAEPNPACWKAALYAAGEIATATLRPPMSEVSNEATQRLLDGISGARHLTGTTTL